MASNLKIVQTDVSKHLEILPIIRGGGNSARVTVKTASSAAIIVFLVCNVMWCGGSAKCDVAFSAVVLWWTN